MCAHRFSVLGALVIKARHVVLASSSAYQNKQQIPTAASVAVTNQLEFQSLYSCSKSALQNYQCLEICPFFFFFFSLFDVLTLSESFLCEVFCCHRPLIPLFPEEQRKCGFLKLCVYRQVPCYSPASHGTALCSSAEKDVL